MNNWFSLLTRFPWRFDFNSHGLKSIGLISSLADVRRSWGEFDRIRWLITTNPGPIGLQLSLDTVESWRTQDLLKKFLNFFTIRSKVKIQRRKKAFYRRKSRENRELSDSVKTDRWPRLRDGRGPRSHDPMIVSRMILIERSGCIDMLPTIDEIVINLMRPMLHLRDWRLNLMHVLLMTIGWTLVHMIYTLHLMCLYPKPMKRPCVLQT